MVEVGMGYSSKIEESCWTEVKSIANVGKTLAQECNQMLARLGCPTMYCEFATTIGRWITILDIKPGL
jgi:hypothetical protein